MEPYKEDRRAGVGDRRQRAAPGVTGVDRRASAESVDRQEQGLQFLTRFLLASLGLFFFGRSTGFGPSWLTPLAVEVVLSAYLGLNVGLLVHALRHPRARWRIRVVLYLDLAVVAVCVLNDPYEIPPTLMLFAMVVVGSGVRPGYSLFGESLVGALLASTLAIGWRYLAHAKALSEAAMTISLLGVGSVLLGVLLLRRTEAALRAAEMRELRDPTTGLANRRGLEDQAEAMSIEDDGVNLPVAVLLIDPDVELGAPGARGVREADAPLRAMASVLTGTLRSSDLAGRYGSDEFVLLLPMTQGDHAESVAYRIRERLKRESSGEFADRTVTIVVAELPTHGVTLHEIVEQADRTLYRVRSTHGPGRVHRLESMAAGDAAA
jgi:diguanylate cyclase (GGDEF)-like protein